MKPALLSLLYLLTHAIITNGQLAIIKDRDGFTNVRAGSNVNTKIIGKLHNGDVFCYGEEQNGWVNVVYYPADSSDRAYLEGEMPLERLTGLRMTIGGHAVDIPPAAWDNLYDPTLETCNVFADARTGFMYIHLLSTRSAAGGYEMVWIFKNDRYVRRYVDQSNN